MLKVRVAADIHHNISLLLIAVYSVKEKEAFSLKLDRQNLSCGLADHVKQGLQQLDLES